ncbi:sterol-binding protein [Thamnidium elegans]|nr:sterol-binding protein [Thamnidium elegans]
MQSPVIFREIDRFLQAIDESSINELIEKIDGVFEFHIKNNSDGECVIFTIDLKKAGIVIYGKPLGESNTIITMTDSDFACLAKGRLNGQRAFMLGKIKIEGNVQLANKLDTVFKQVSGKSKL